MWTGGQVAEKISLASAADVGTVAVITVSGLIGPFRTLANYSNAATQLPQSGHSVKNSVTQTRSRIPVFPEGTLNPSTQCQKRACCSLTLWRSSPTYDGGRLYSILCGQLR